MILCDVGEVGIHWEDNTYLLRPSFYAMSRLGNPKTVVSILSLVFDNSVELIARFIPDELPNTISFRAALDVLRNCWASDIKDRDWVLGSIRGDRYIPGIIPLDHVFPLARCLLKHGLLGDMAWKDEKKESETEEPAKENDDEYTSQFVARDHVAFAMAHLGVSERDAWSMTMTSLLLAVRAKYPQEAAKGEPKGEGTPITLKEHDATMEWLDKVNQKRNKRRNKRNG